MNITIKIYIFELIKVPKSILQKEFSFFGPNNSFRHQIQHIRVNIDNNLILNYILTFLLTFILSYKVLFDLLCKDENIPLNSHNAIDAKKSFNNIKLHLNIWGSSKLLENLVKYLKGFSSWVNFTRNESETYNGLSTKSMKSFSTVNSVSFFKKPLLSASNEDICLGQHLNNLHRKNIGHLFLAHININYICCKFGQLFDDVKDRLIF